MGDIAEMVLDGILCECCGTYIGDETGYPRLCDDCKRDQKSSERFGTASSCKSVKNSLGVSTPVRTTKMNDPSRVQCPICLYWVKKKGLADHTKAKHEKDTLTHG